MDTVSKLTVYFEEPFWVGVFERMENGKLSVCKVTFGAEPKDYEVWEFVLKHYDRLVFSAAIASEMKKTADNTAWSFVGSISTKPHRLRINAPTHFCVVFF